MRRDDEIASALRATLMSPNVLDSNWEPANVVDAITKVASALTYAGRSTKPEVGSDSLADAALHISDGIHRVADALESIACALSTPRGA